MKTSLKALAVAAFLLPTAAVSQSAYDSEKWLFGVGISTAGPKIEAAYRLSEKLHVRGFVGRGITAKFSESLAGIEYDARMKLAGAAAQLDYYPTKRGLRFSAGLFAENSRFSGLASGELSIGDEVYHADIETRIEFANTLVPFVSVGYEAFLTPRLSLSADIGAIAAGEVQVMIVQTGGEPIDVTDILKQIAGTKRGVSNLYPFASFALTYRF